MIKLHVEGQHSGGILPASNVRNPEFTYFLFLLWRWLWSTPYISHFTTKIVNVFYLHCLKLESSSNIIFIAHVSTHISEFACWSTSRAAFQSGDSALIQVQRTLNQASEWGSACAQHATIAQALLLCPLCVADREIFTLWPRALDTERRSLWEEVHDICSSRTRTSLKLRLWPYNPLIWCNCRGWGPLKIIVQMKAGFC